MAALYSTASLADNASESDSEGLQEVIVTASHREVSAQNLPISITAVTGADLSKLGIQDMADLARSMAGVHYTDKGPFSGVNGANLNLPTTFNISDALNIFAFRPDLNLAKSGSLTSA